ncbi:hypothetical protein DFP72DRAFT_848900 [Ephemerocybe angulata]|uniref:Uncharacterized protein n=1 Tax=Ephemerocybe angulata TaxID=980116 RepID=A0A8H6HWH2_9AGAR|nr:hypothetical protein DFP72DRAFT_848900 [Tulosesus angulatus]
MSYCVRKVVHSASSRENRRPALGISEDARHIRRVDIDVNGNSEATGCGRRWERGRVNADAGANSKSGRLGKLEEFGDETVVMGFTSYDWDRGSMPACPKNRPKMARGVNLNLEGLGMVIIPCNAPNFRPETTERRPASDEGGMWRSEVGRQVESTTYRGCATSERAETTYHRPASDRAVSEIAQMKRATYLGYDEVAVETEIAPTQRIDVRRARRAEGDEREVESGEDGGLEGR